MEKRYDQKISEKQTQDKWLQEKTYTTQETDKPTYSIDTPPPTVSGSLHIGHIFSYTQTDLIARYKRLNGFSVFYPFGFDDNGLPTERFVEKKKKVRAHELGRSQFIKLCLQETHEVEEQFKHLWQRIGLSVDWDKCYSTISKQTRKISQASFIALHNKGFTYRKYEPALYCTTCRTSVAQAELDDIEKPSFFNDIVFKDETGNDLIIGTTRPELLPSCVALLYNPNDERYQHLKDSNAIVPIFGHKVPVYQDEHVEIEKGTGLVMCCTFGDKTDIEWYKKFDLPYKQSIGQDGKMTAVAGPLAGLKVAQAREKIIELLKEQNLIIVQKPITHAVNVHERCKKDIEYVALSQWFLEILKHKQTFLAQADKINWYPNFMKARYKNWVENISWDWCISRQRFYGIPFPVWHCQSCEHVILANIDQLPIDPQETPYDKPCPQCGSTDVVADTDVMDTWNTSSLTPYILSDIADDNTKIDVLQKETPAFLPMAMRPQAHDIIRTWAFYTIVKTWMHHNVVPWNNIIISGHVLSDAKVKLSKSKDGGKLSPEKLLEQYSADVIRYWTASGNLGHDIAFSESQLKIGQRLVTKLWNAFRFASEHTTLVQPNELPQNFDPINQWLLHTATECFTTYQNYFEKNEYNHALATIETFFWNNFCDNYLEIIKHQLFNPADYDKNQITTTQWTLYTVGLRVLQMFAPFLPFITETLYGLLYQKNIGISSIHVTDFNTIQQPYAFPEGQRVGAALISVVQLVRKLKTEKQLSFKTPLASLRINTLKEELRDALDNSKKLLFGATQTTNIEVTNNDTIENNIEEKDSGWHVTVQL